MLRLLDNASINAGLSLMWLYYNARMILSSRRGLTTQCVVGNYQALVVAAAEVVPAGEVMTVVSTCTGVVVGEGMKVVSPWKAVVVEVGAAPQPDSPGKEALAQSKVEVDDAEVVVADLVEVLIVVEVGL